MSKGILGFLVAFLVVYGGMNLLFFIKLRAAQVLSAGGLRLVAVVVACFTFGPLLVALLGERLPGVLRPVLAYPVYLWMGGVFQFFAWSVALLVLLVGFRAHGVLAGREPLLAPSPRLEFALPLGIVVLLSLYGLWEARQIRVEHITIHSARVPPGAGRFRIVQISDVHLGILENPGRLERILSQVRSAQPDLLVSTGDLVDVCLEDAAPLAEALRGIPAPAGRFAVTGNHEFFAGLESSLAFHVQAGFKVLRGEGQAVAPWLSVAGVDDQAGERLGLVVPASETALLESLPSDGFRLLLKHTPSVALDSIGRFDLQLSGHSHGGQIFPFGLVTWFSYSVPCGLSTRGGRSRIYVSRGSGTWGPPIRVFTPPEVTVIDLLPAGNPPIAGTVVP